MVTQTIAPEWAKPAEIAAIFGFTRPYVYTLLNAGDIRYRQIRRPGAKRGQTLIEVASVRRFIEDGAEGGTA